MDKALMKFSNGYLTDIQTEQSSHPGCETCDYGSKFINELSFVFSDKIATYKVSNMYEYAVSEAWLMHTILPVIEELQKMSEDDFISWLKNKLTEICPDGECYGRKEYGVTLDIRYR